MQLSGLRQQQRDRWRKKKLEEFMKDLPKRKEAILKNRLVNLSNFWKKNHTSNTVAKMWRMNIKRLNVFGEDEFYAIDMRNHERLNSGEIIRAYNMMNRIDTHFTESLSKQTNYSEMDITGVNPMVSGIQPGYSKIGVSPELYNRLIREFNITDNNSISDTDSIPDLLDDDLVQYFSDNEETPKRLVIKVKVNNDYCIGIPEPIQMDGLYGIYDQMIFVPESFMLRNCGNRCSISIIMLPNIETIYIRPIVPGTPVTEEQYKNLLRKIIVGSVGDIIDSIVIEGMKSSESDDLLPFGSFIHPEIGEYEINVIESSPPLI